MLVYFQQKTGPFFENVTFTRALQAILRGGGGGSINKIKKILMKSYSINIWLEAYTLKDSRIKSVKGLRLQDMLLCQSS